MHRVIEIHQKESKVSPFSANIVCAGSKISNLHRLRDKYDELGRLFKLIADNDEFNETTSDGLMNYSKAMTLLGDVKDIEVQRLQTKVTSTPYFTSNKTKRTFH